MFWPAWPTCEGEQLTPTHSKQTGQGDVDLNARYILQLSPRLETTPWLKFACPVTDSRSELSPQVELKLKRKVFMLFCPDSSLTESKCQVCSAFSDESTRLISSGFRIQRNYFEIIGHNLLGISWVYIEMSLVWNRHFILCSKFDKNRQTKSDLKTEVVFIRTSLLLT